MLGGEGGRPGNRAPIPIPLFVRFLVLLLSIAVLVLDRSFRYRISPLDQPSQYPNDPLQIGLANQIQFRIDRIER
jgi:hypothetical protein